jgi:hypothetical protein
LAAFSEPPSDSTWLSNASARFAILGGELKQDLPFAHGFTDTAGNGFNATVARRSEAKHGFHRFQNHQHITARNALILRDQKLRYLARQRRHEPIITAFFLTSTRNGIGQHKTPALAGMAQAYGLTRAMDGSGKPHAIQ